MQEVHWKQLQSNPYLQSLHPLMITNEGYKLEKRDRIVGMSRFANKVELEVTYDKTYVMEVLSRNVFAKLHITEWNQIQGILSEAWKRYKETLR